jgi:hypothetical protein
MMNYDHDLIMEEQRTLEGEELEEARGNLRHARARLASAWTEELRHKAAGDVAEAEEHLARLEGYQDPFQADLPSTDPARDLANHRELARRARARRRG